MSVNVIRQLKFESRCLAWPGLKGGVFVA